MRKRRLAIVLVRPKRPLSVVSTETPETTDDLTPERDVTVTFEVEVPKDARPGDQLRLVTHLPSSTLDERQAFPDRICAVGGVPPASLDDCEAHARTNGIGVTVQ
jgi:hypothetical protein